jgi:3-oxo-5alpha-steroid 4-dehydrogenase
MSSTNTTNKSSSFPIPTTTVDILIVGFGAAGASAAMHSIETLEKLNQPGTKQNPKILVVDRFEGGGATSRSGGIVYFGGGTDVQNKLGVKDDPQNMFNYLKKELDGSVSDQTLWRFCETSSKTAAWMRDSFKLKINTPDDSAVLCPFKTSNAPDKYSLFYSGSETAAPFSDVANPAPRGHKAVGPGNLVGTGNVLFEAMEKAVYAAESRGIKVQTLTKVVELIFDDEKKVVGARLLSLRDAPIWVKAMHYTMFKYGGLTNPAHFLDPAIQKLLTSIENNWGQPEIVYASKGVILATGGFCRNHEKLQEHVPTHFGAMPIGSAGDDGFGIFELGIKQAGAGYKFLDKASLWKFIVPAASMAKCVAVNPQGERIINEDVYGARLAEYIGKKGNGKGWLIIDQKIWDACYNESTTAGSEMLLFQKYFTMLNLRWNRIKANTLPELAKATGMNPTTLQNTINEYNTSCKKQKDEKFGKKPHLLSEISQGPFYAICADYFGTLYPSPFITLGGITVDENTGQVISQQGKIIPGLFAAGRVAAGVCSTSYVSGLSLADCVFAGRRAAEYAVANKIFGMESDNKRVSAKM